MKELVTLRRKPMNNGGYSLYLDYHLDGRRRKEYLKMYLTSGKTRLEKYQNDETLKAAEIIRAQRTIELQGKAAHMMMRNKVTLMEYILDVIENSKSRVSNGRILNLTTLHSNLAEFGESVNVGDIDRRYVLRFIDFLRKKGLAPSSQKEYVNCLSSVLNIAVRNDIIAFNPIRKLCASERPQSTGSIRQYLTIDEIRKLRNVRCKNDMKNAFLFSCFTGLRLSDIRRLTSQMIRQTADGMQIEMRQQKTQRIVYIPLPANALEFLPDDLPNRDQIFRLQKTSSSIRYALDKIIREAGITKHITFHCARHTYATLLLTYGADIYTVSKLLGHTTVSQTQVYAKIVDSKRREAVNLIPEL